VSVGARHLPVAGRSAASPLAGAVPSDPIVLINGKTQYSYSYDPAFYQSVDSNLPLSIKCGGTVQVLTVTFKILL